MRQLLILSNLLFFFYLTPAIAQNDTRGWERNSAYNRMYDRNSVVEVKGEIVAVERIIPTTGMSAGFHLMINTGKETISVHLGPTWYIDSQNFELEVGQKVDIEGSQVLLNAQYVIIARKVEIGSRVLNLRDRNGIPKWSGRRQRK